MFIKLILISYSLAADQDHEVFRGSVAESYERIHGALIGALHVLGVRAGLRRDRAADSDREGTGMCFHASTPLDIVWSSGKGVGSAQRRTQGRVLHHGSIKLDTTPLEGAIATLRAAEGNDGLELGVVAREVRRAFERNLGMRLEAAAPTAAEIERAGRLGQRYLDPEFVRRR